MNEAQALSALSCIFLAGMAIGYFAGKNEVYEKGCPIPLLTVAESVELISTQPLREGDMFWEEEEATE